MSASAHRRALLGLLAGLVALAAVVLPAAPAAASTGAVTVVATGGAAEGAGWTYDAGSGTLTVAADVSIDAAELVTRLDARDLTVAARSIAVDADVVTAVADRSLILRSQESITVAAGVRIETVGGDVVLWSDAGGDLADAARAGGGIQLGTDHPTIGTCTGGALPDPVEIVTGGGDIVLSGGAVADVAALRTDGFASYRTGLPLACSAYYFAVGLFGADLDARGDTTGGDVVIRGEARNFDGLIWTTNIGGAYGSMTTVRTSGDGAIDVVGDAGRTLANASATLSRNPWAVVNSGRLQTQRGPITVTGTSNVARSNARGHALGGVVESSSGTIEIVDATASTSNANYTGPYFNGVRLGRGDLASSTSDVHVVADRHAFNSATIATAGTVTIRPYGPSFLSALTYPVPGLTSTDVGALTLARDGSTADVTIASAVPSIPGDIRIFGDTIAVDGTLATAATLELHAAVAATQSAAITALDLRLSGAGTFTLTDDGNLIGSVAGGTSAARLGGLRLVDAAGGLTVGVVDADGIAATGPVDIATLAGDIALVADVDTGDATDAAIVLNAGRASDVGDTSGGDVVVTGTPVLTTGAGGVVRLFSGSDAASTGLTALVGGAASTRAGVDETTTSFSPALAADGRYALYRSLDAVGATGGGEGDARGGSVPTTTCMPTPLVAGAIASCRVDGGPGGVEILWRAGVGGTTVAGPVRLDADGTGTFTFVVPTAAEGDEATVELVAWDAPRSLGVVGPPAPVAVRAGGGPMDAVPLPASAPAAATVLALVLGARWLRRPRFADVDARRLG